MNLEATEEILPYVEGKVGRLRLNRPKAIHALNLSMVQAMTNALIAWRDDEAVRLIMIDHAEGRGFCAGGDVVGVARSAQGHGAAGDAFFFQEYRMNHLMYTYPKHGVAFLDGITMGGGVGIACPCKYRVATERTVFSMPETGIGLFPDVGGGRYLSRLPGRLAQYLGLTGGRLSGAECVALRLATHYIPSGRLDAVKEELFDRPEDVEQILRAASEPPGRADILADSVQIDHCFASDRLEDILAALEAHGSEWAKSTLATLKTKSPLSCKITLRLLTESLKIKDFADEMRLEFGIVHRIFRAPDFREGVRALLIDKDLAPQWNPATPEAVTGEMVDQYFQPLKGPLAWSPLDL